LEIRTRIRIRKRKMDLPVSLQPVRATKKVSNMTDEKMSAGMDSDTVGVEDMEEGEDIKHLFMIREVMGLLLSTSLEVTVLLQFMTMAATGKLRFTKSEVTATLNPSITTMGEVTGETIITREEAIRRIQVILRRDILVHTDIRPRISNANISKKPSTFRKAIGRTTKSVSLSTKLSASN
jgi:hypothetical protein